MLNNILLKIFNLPVIIRTRFYPRFNRLLFRLKGINFGRNMTIMGKVSVIGKGNIRIGENFHMTSGNHVNPISGNDEASWFVEQKARLTIGNNVGMSSTRIWTNDAVTIGNNVQVGANVLIMDTDTHQLDYRLRRNPDDDFFSGLSNGEIWQKKLDGTISAPILIEDDVWIGAHCIILKGVTIGARSIIGAGSVVTKSIPEDCIAAGNPCKIIRKTI